MQLVSEALMTFIMLLLTVLIVMVFFPPVSELGNSVADIKLASTTAEVASIASAIQIAPDDTEYELTLPRINPCRLRVFGSFIEISSGSRREIVNLMSIGGENLVEKWDDSEDCLEKPRIIFRKESGRGLIEASEKEGL